MGRCYKSIVSLIILFYMLLCTNVVLAEGKDLGTSEVPTVEEGITKKQERKF